MKISKKIVLAAASVMFLNSCLGTLVMRPNLSSDVMMAVDSENIGVTLDLELDLPDTLVVTVVESDGDSYESSTKYSHNGREALAGKINQYLFAKFDEGTDLAIAVRVKEYRIEARDLSKKGQKFFVAMVGSGTLQYDYVARAEVEISIDHGEAVTRKQFSIEEHQQNVTDYSQQNTYYSNGMASTTSQVSSTNSVDGAIGSAFDAVNTRVVLLLNQYVNKVIN